MDGLYLVGQPSSAALRLSTGRRKRGRPPLRGGGASSAADRADSPTSASPTDFATWRDRRPGGGPPAKRARTAAQGLGNQLAAAVATLVAEAGLAAPQARVPPDSDPAPAESDVLPVELAAAAAALQHASWRDWFLPDAAWQQLARLLDVPPAARYSGDALAFFLQHAPLRPPDCGAFVVHARALPAFPATAAAQMGAAGHERAHRVLTDAQLGAIVDAMAPDAGEHGPVWRAFLRWARPHGGAELQWRANAAQRMLGDPVRRATLTKPPDVRALRDVSARVHHYNRTVVPLVNRVRQCLRVETLPWARLRQAAETLAPDRLGAAEHALLHAILGAQSEMALCRRRSTVKKNPVPLATQASPAALLLPPALPPGTTFAAATAQLLQPGGSDPWAAELAPSEPAGVAPPPPTPPAEDADTAEVDAWVAAHCTSPPDGHAGTRFAVLWRLFARRRAAAAATEHDALLDRAAFVAALQRAGLVSAQYAPPAPLPVALTPPATLADAQARLALLAEDAGPALEAHLDAVSAAPARGGGAAVESAIDDLSGDLDSVDFSQ